MKTLDQLRIGSSGTVESIEGIDDVALRLMEMGLTPGVEIAVVGSAPLGDPLELEVRGYRLSVRKSEARRVVISGQ